MTLLEIALADFVDIAVVGVLFWGLLVWTRRMHARMALIGLAFLGAFYLLARQFELQLTAWIFQGFFAVLVVLLVVVFQDDLRRLFEQIAALGLGRRVSRPRGGSLAVLVRAMYQLAAKRQGALVVLPGREPLDRYLQGGIVLQATISEELIDSLFGTASAGHDGALVMREDRLERFAVYLPLSENRGELGPGGTRHAAALGLAERSDALCLVVSEERGTIAVARQGRLEIIDDPEELLARLQEHAQHVVASARRTGRGWLARHLAEGLLSFALAFGAWLLLVPGAAVQETTYEVEVGVENLPSGYTLDVVRPDVVNVTVKGPRRAFLLAPVNDFRLVIDAAYVRFGRRTFEFGVESITHGTDLTVVNVEPRKVRLDVRKE